MKVSRARAEENRRTVVDAAGRLFREHGFDGVGLNELMRAAGLTHGGFYKQFKSKQDLAVEACDSLLAGSAERWQRVATQAGGEAFPVLVRRYLSAAHRDRRADGCAFAALGPDVARQDGGLRRSFEAGLGAHLAVLDETMHGAPQPAPSNGALAALSTMVGALLLSRMVEDDTLSRRILDAAAGALLDAPASTASST